jgi:hypothetical protein
MKLAKRLALFLALALAAVLLTTAFVLTVSSSASAYIYVANDQTQKTVLVDGNPVEVVASSYELDGTYIISVGTSTNGAHIVGQTSFTTSDPNFSITVKVSDDLGYWSPLKVALNNGHVVLG